MSHAVHDAPHSARHNAPMGAECRYRYQAARASSGLSGAPGRRSVTFSHERTPWLPLSARISSKPAPIPRMAAELRLGAKEKMQALRARFAEALTEE